MKWILMLSLIKIRKIIHENSVKQLYKPRNKDELWTSMWHLNFVGIYLYFTFAKIYACFH